MIRLMCKGTHTLADWQFLTVFVGAGLDKCSDDICPLHDCDQCGCDRCTGCKFRVACSECCDFAGYVERQHYEASKRD